MKDVEEAVKIIKDSICYDEKGQPINAFEEQYKRAIETILSYIQRLENELKCQEIKVEHEIWLEVKDFENYEVSDSGKIRSKNYLNSGVSKELKPKIRKDGCLEVSLSKNNQKKTFSLARLVYETYSRQKLTRQDIIMYKNGDKTDVAYDNLYIMSSGERQKITYAERNRFAYLFDFYGEHLTITEISERTGIKRDTIEARLRDNWNIYEAAEVPVAQFKTGVNKNEKEL